MKIRKEVLIAVDSEVQLFSVKPLMDKLKERGTSFDVYIPSGKDDDAAGVYDSVYKIVNKLGYPVIRGYGDTSYKVGLFANGGGSNVNAPCRYLLRYQYAIINAKPNPTYLPEWYRGYHAILCESTIDRDILSVYGKVFLVPSLRFIGFKKSIRKDRKKTVLYLPTWSDVSSIDSIASGLDRLRSDGYRVIVKLHHGTSHREGESSRKDIRNHCDEYFESDTPIADLMKVSDVVVSDNSGAIYDAMYVNIPVVVYGSKVNDRRLGGINTPHYDWIKKGVILNPRTSDSLVSAVRDSLKRGYLLKQIESSDGVMVKSYSRGAVGKWLKVIDYMLKDEIPEGYIKMHAIYNQYITSKEEHVEGLIGHTKGLEDRIRELESDQVGIPGVLGSIKILLLSLRRFVARAFKK